jgi:hypothetical protein
MGAGYETFDAELVGACRAWELTLKDRGEGLVTVLLQDSLAAIKLRKTSPGQSLAIRARRAAQALCRRSGPKNNDCRGTAELKETSGRIRRPTPRSGHQEISVAYTNRPSVWR